MALRLFIFFTIFKYIRSLPLFPFISPLFLSFCVCVCVWVCLLLGRLISKLKQLLLFPKILYHSSHLLIFFFSAKMGDNIAATNHHQVFDVSIDVPSQNGSKCFDDDGRLNRTGTLISLPCFLCFASPVLFHLANLI